MLHSHHAHSRPLAPSYRQHSGRVVRLRSARSNEIMKSPCTDIHASPYGLTMNDISLVVPLMSFDHISSYKDVLECVTKRWSLTKRQLSQPPLHVLSVVSYIVLWLLRYSETSVPGAKPRYKVNRVVLGRGA